jgi:hypothetical protein
MYDFLQNRAARPNPAGFFASKARFNRAKAQGARPVFLSRDNDLV